MSTWKHVINTIVILITFSLFGYVSFFDIPDQIYPWVYLICGFMIGIVTNIVTSYFRNKKVK